MFEIADGSVLAANFAVGLFHFSALSLGSAFLLFHYSVLRTFSWTSFCPIRFSILLCLECLNIQSTCFLRQRQVRSQTSEKDETSFERRRCRPLRGLWARLPRKFWNLKAQKCSFKYFPWHFSSENTILGQNQDEAIASSCLMLATALWGITSP